MGTTHRSTITSWSAGRDGSHRGSRWASAPRLLACRHRGARGRRRQGGKKHSPGLSKADRGPLGKHPDIEAIVARQRLQLPLWGRIRAAQINQAWKRCDGEHYPDRGGEHDRMQLVNGARNQLLGRGLS
jgi:hypothetical protein